MIPKYKVSINILNWNRKDDLYEAIKGLENQTFKDFEIVVVDNNSTDGSAEMVLREFPSVRLIRLPWNMGVAGGRNVGIMNSYGEIIFFLDNDAILHEDGLEKIVEQFEQDQGIGIIGLQVVNYYTKEHQKVGWPFGLYNLKRKDQEFEAWTFPGGASAIRKSVFNDVGLFASHYFFAGEEDDLSLRAIKHGYKILYYPHVKMFHKLSPEKRYDYDKRMYFYSTRNKLWVYWTYFSLSNTVKKTAEVIIKRFFYSIKERAFFYYVKGLFSAFFGLPFIIKNRNPIGKVAEQRYIQISSFPQDSLWIKVKRFLNIR